MKELEIAIALFIAMCFLFIYSIYKDNKMFWECRKAIDILNNTDVSLRECKAWCRLWG